VIANGEADLAKHMFAFVMGLDLQALIMVLYGLWKITDDCSRLTLRTVAVIAAAVIFVSIFNISSRLSNKKEIIDSGDYVRFGLSSSSGQQTGLLWKVIKNDGSGIWIFAAEPVSYRSFDDADAAKASGTKPDQNRLKYGSNYWPESRIRNWLNSDFLKDFTPEEQGMIRENKHDCILSGADKTKAQKGDNQFFWTHVPSEVAFGVNRAYSLSVTDKVFLPDVVEFSEYIAKAGLEKRPEKSYWLETPYYGNSSMVRVVGEDGYVYMKDACFSGIGVRPLIIIDAKGLSYSGNGTEQEPYVFNIISNAGS
jgi:hypothetical protein